MVPHIYSILRAGRMVVVIGSLAVLAAGCVSNRAGVSADYSNLSGPQVQTSVAELSARHRSDPRNKQVAIHYAAALRAAGQNDQAASVMEGLVGAHRGDPDVSLAYAKALTAQGRFDQALAVIDNAINPANPDWEALSVRGAALDQMGQHPAARQAYEQALLVAPHQASLRANLGLSYAMTGELAAAEAQLRAASQLPTATSRVRQNLALVIGLQGRFDESRALYSRELPPEEVEANMAYIRAMLTQQNRWQTIQGDS